MELLKKLTSVTGASGNEKKVSELIKSEIKAYVDEISTDALGNLTAHKKGTGMKIMLAAHMDEIGVVVTFIDDEGFLRFSNVGGVYTKQLLGKRVVFPNGTMGVISSENDNKELKLSKLYIDIGAKNKKEAEEKVLIGDTACFSGEFFQNEERVVSKALDNRVGCYALIEAAKKIKGQNDIYFVFTTQEEVGLRGARAAAYKINPDVALAIDVTDTGDTPNGEKMAIELGGGAAIKVMDRSIICSWEVREALIKLAKEKKIPFQLEIMTDGGTDAGVIHLTKEGIKTGGISIPTRYIHTPCEMADVRDINAVVDLIAAFCDTKNIGE